MPKFSYRASTSEGEIQEGVIEGEDEALVAGRLRELNLWPIEINPDLPSRKLEAFGKIRKRDILAFTQELSTLIEAGVPLDQSLAALEDIIKSGRFKEVISEIRNDIRKGMTFSDALARHAAYFSRLYVSMIKVGEASGALELVLRELVEFSERENDLRDYIGSIMLYPLITLAVMSVAVTIILTFVTPRFVIIFKEIEQTLPLPTLVLIWVSEVVVGYWWLILGLLALSAFGFRAYLRTEAGRHSVDKFKLKTPILGGLIQMLTVVRFSRSLGILTRGGVPLLSSLSIAQEAVENRIVATAVSEVRRKVRAGERIALQLKESGIFPPLFIHMVAVGEKTGRLEDMLIKVADTYELRLRNRIRRLIAFLEPTLILVMGFLTAFIVSAIILPIFAMNELPF